MFVFKGVTNYMRNIFLQIFEMLMKCWIHADMMIPMAKKCIQNRGMACLSLYLWVWLICTQCIAVPYIQAWPITIILFRLIIIIFVVTIFNIFWNLLSLLLVFSWFLYYCLYQFNLHLYIYMCLSRYLLFALLYAFSWSWIFVLEFYEKFPLRLEKISASILESIPNRKCWHCRCGLLKSFV